MVMGVVFIGMVGAGMVMGDWELAFSLLVMSALTYALRFAAVWLLTPALYPGPIVSPKPARRVSRTRPGGGATDAVCPECAQRVSDDHPRAPNANQNEGPKRQQNTNVSALFDHDKRFLSPVRLPVSPPRHGWVNLF